MIHENEIKLLAAADWHWYENRELEQLKKIDFDICVTLGDIPINALRALKAISADRPMIGIAGNHDDWDTPEHGGAENISGKSVYYCGYDFAGLSGSALYKYGDYPMLTQRESLEICHKIDKADIFLSHDSMYHLIGKDKPHAGLLGIDYYNIKNRPKLNLCGHHHVSGEYMRYGIKTICVFRCALITFPNISVKTVF
ncbi:MAG: metallophosphoesterase family protein [Ruminiclostridium sp.]|nr:metallophosphoesterase family protein [Ruminiclostridium sp.]